MKAIFFIALLLLSLPLYSQKLSLTQQIEQYQQLLASQKKEKGKTHPEVSKTLNQLFNLYVDADRFDELRQCMIELLDVEKQRSGEKSLAYAQLLERKAKMHVLFSEYAKAHEVMVGSLRTANKIISKNTPKYLKSLEYLAEIKIYRKQYFGAQQLYKAILKREANTRNKTSQRYLRVLTKLIQSIEHQNYYADMVKPLEELVLLQQKITHSDLNKNRLKLADLYMYLSRYNVKKQYKEALTLYQAVQTNSKSDAGDLYGNYFKALQGLVQVYLVQKQVHKAQPFIAQMKKVIDKTNAWTTDELIKRFAEQNDTVSIALTDFIYTKARKKMASQGYNLFYVSTTFDHLYFCEKHKRRAQAQQIIAHLEKIAPEIYDGGWGIKANVYMFLAERSFGAGNLNKARKIYAEGIKLLLAHAQNELKTLTPQERKRTWVEHQNWYTTFRIFVLDYLQKYPKETALLKKMLNITLITKGQLLTEDIQLQQRLAKAKDPSTLSKYKRYKALKNKIASSIGLSPQEKQKRGIYIEDLERKANQLETVIRAALPSRNTQRLIVDFESLRKRLKKREAAIEIIRTQYFQMAALKNDSVPLNNHYKYLALIVTKNSHAPHLIIFDNADLLEKRYAKYYRNSVVFKRTDKYSYQKFWQPIAQYLQKKKIKKVYFSPDGVYHQINLNTLRNPKTGQYLEDELAVYQVTSLRDIKPIAQRKKVGKSDKQRIWLFGRPDYQLDLKKLENAEQLLRQNKKNRPSPIPAVPDSLRKKGKRALVKGFIDLPGTQTEVENIEKILRSLPDYSVNVRLDAQAHELALKNVQNAQILHVATHGFFIPRFGGNGKGLKRKIIKKINQEPMLRSGIALAGVESFSKAKEKPLTEDGILTAYEAVMLNLKNTELVVLSACETGLGKVASGDGVYGLQRALLIAGAQTLIMSLWKVDDAATQMLMGRFYKEWIMNKKSKRSAFKAAQLYLRNHTNEKNEKPYAAPYYWGAFVIIQ